MNLISWQTMPAIKGVPVKQKRAFLQKLSVPRNRITLIGVQLLGPPMEDLANNLPTELIFKHLRDFSVGPTSSEHHTHYCVIKSPGSSCIRTGEFNFRVIDTPTSRSSALVFSEFEGNRNNSSIFSSWNYVPEISMHISLIPNNRIPASRTIWIGLIWYKDAKEMVLITFPRYDQKLRLIKFLCAPFVNGIFSVIHSCYRPDDFYLSSLPPNSLQIYCFMDSS